MIRRRALISTTLGAAAMAGGAGVAWWHGRTRATAAPADLWAMRFARPEGGELVMAELRGKPLLINFWATWCAPCVREMPEIDRFQAVFGQRGGQVIGLAIDGPTAVREFLGRVSVKFPIGLAGLEGTDLIQQLGNQQGGLPFTVLIDAEGRLVRRKMGEISLAELTTWSSAL